jgi:hypothetical protein
MTDITSLVTIKEDGPRLETKTVSVEAPATAVTADTIDVTLADYGLGDKVGVLGFDIDNNVQEQPTWAISTGVLTITVGGTANTAARRFVIYG